MHNHTIVKPSLEVLLDQDLLDMINAVAANHYRNCTKQSIHSSIIALEDLVQQGLCSVASAYKSFDMTRATNANTQIAFRTYVWPYISNAMMTYCIKFGHPLSISEKAARTELKQMTSIGVVHIDRYNNDEDEEFDIPCASGLELSDDIKNYYFVGFTNLERSLMNDHILEGHSLQELSNRYNISKARTGQIIRELTGRMKTRIIYYEQNNHR